MPTSRPGYRADLEALRGLAILLVVAYHAGVPVLAGGFVGVDVFFVLSGYFTTRLLVQEYGTTGSINVLAFWGRRALRLLPVLLVVVAATLLAVWTLWAPIDRAEIAATARAVLSGRANNAFAAEAVNYFGGASSPFLHAWSLAVELQVALFGPLIFLALAGLGGWRLTQSAGSDREHRISVLLHGVFVGLVVLGAVSLAFAIWLTGISPSWAFFGTAARAWEFVAGGVLAMTLPAASADGDVSGDARGRGWWLQAIGLAAVIAAALSYDRATPYPGTAALLPVLAAAAVIAGGVYGRGVLGADAPPVRTLAWFGRVSYSWYLWHWPMVITGGVLMPSLGVWGRLVWSATALGPAWLTYRWIESPLREHRGESTARAPWLRVAAVAASATMVVGAGAMLHAAERRVETGTQRTFAAARMDRMQHNCWSSTASDIATRSASACIFGDPSGTTTVALFGDSHAEHWLAALDRLGRERGWRVVLMVKGGCPVADAPELIDARAQRWGRQCAQYREAAVQRIIALRPAVAVLSSYDEYVTRDVDATSDRAADGRVSPAAWGRGLRRTYTRLADAGVPVVAIRGTPYPGFDVPACLSRRAAGLLMADVCEYARDEALHGAARAAQVAAVNDVAARGLAVAGIDLADAVCGSARCAVVRGGRVVFTDGNHLTARYTRSVAGTVGEKLDAAMASVGLKLP
jgi:peptidoglycan/LPS O-acetylase OafA/YrhL